MAVRFQLLCFLLRYIAIAASLVYASNSMLYANFCVRVQLTAIGVNYDAPAQPIS